MRKKSGKNANTWGLYNMVLNNEWVNQENKEGKKNYMEANEMKNNNPKSLGYNKNSSKR